MSVIGKPERVGAIGKRGNDVGKINFGATPVEQLATLMLVVDELHVDIRGNGQIGLKAKAENFMAEHDGVMKEQQRQHDSNSRKLNAIMVLLTLVIALTGVLGALVTAETMRRSDLDPAKLFHSLIDDPVVSFRQQPTQFAGD